MNSDSFSATVSRRRFIRQAACAALGTTAVTNTLTDLRLINSAIAQTAPSDYKALICIFLSGGNDSNNLFIPLDTDVYQPYATIRSPILAIPNADGSPTATLALNGKSGGRSYGIHPSCPELRNLYNAGKVAGIFNVGTLVYPMTKSEYNSGSVPRPPSLMSHGDQQTQWQTSIPDQQPGTGWAGRCADLLHTLNPSVSGNDVLSLCISLAGNNIFEVGGVAQPYIVNGGGVVGLNANNVGTRSANTGRQQALRDLIGIGKVQSNMLVENYALALDHSLALGGALASSLSNSPLATYWNTFPLAVTPPNGGATFNSGLLGQLKMIARIIDAGYRSAAQGGLGMKRQIFFCAAGGYDTHINETDNSANSTVNAQQVIRGTQANLFAEFSQGMNAIQNAMVKIGQQYGDSAFEKRVTTFTASDFGRSLATNGLGSDHGWGGHHLIMGGAVKGGTCYGKFPMMATNGLDDVGAGRLLPTTAVDQFAATMAKWFGVDQTHMGTIFPNLARFETPDLGFMNA